MKFVQFSSIFAALFASGCVASMEDAPFDAEVNVPEDLQIAWSVDNNTLDLSGLLIPFDVGVFRNNQATGALEPLPNTRVEITSSFGGVYLIPQQAVEVVSYPGLPGGISSQEDVKAACTDANGDYAMNEDWCAWYWDTESQTFYQFAGTYADAYEYDTADGFYWFAPTHMVAETDNRGLVRAYMLIDVMPVASVAGGDGTIEDVSILASIGWNSQTFMITSGGN
jgi:hypothetical protein